MRPSIYAREEEIKILQAMFTSSQAEFLAIYGRRRVGKTYLVKEFFKHQKNCIFFKVTGLRNAPLTDQIKNFITTIGETFYAGAPLIIHKTWHQTFALLHHAIQNTATQQKIILFLDELPWMVTRNSKFLASLDYYWNHYWSDDSRIKLIICGSSSSWIVNKIIKDKGGFHNRLTRRIHLSPLTLKETKTFLKQSGIKLDSTQVLTLYMAIGGIPYYLKHLEKGLSAAQLIEKIAFSKKSLLLEEFDHLFYALFDRADNYISVLRHIAHTQYGISQETLLNLLDKSLQGQNGLEILHQLEEADFILGFKPHFHRRKGIYYRVIDEYSLFYFQWIEPIKNTLQTYALEPGYWQAIQNTPEWYAWAGYAFESICYKHIPQIRKALHIPVTAIADTWRYVPKKKASQEGAQIDLLFDRRDEVITLCEIKFTQQAFTLTKEFAQNLMHKTNVFKKQTSTQKQLFWTLISAHGVKNNFYSDDLIQGIVTLTDFFEE